MRAWNRRQLPILFFIFPIGVVIVQSVWVSTKEEVLDNSVRSNLQTGLRDFKLVNQCCKVYWANGIWVSQYRFSKQYFFLILKYDQMFAINKLGCNNRKLKLPYDFEVFVVDNYASFAISAVLEDTYLSIVSYFEVYIFVFNVIFRLWIKHWDQTNILTWELVKVNFDWTLRHSVFCHVISKTESLFTCVLKNNLTFLPGVKITLNKHDRGRFCVVHIFQLQDVYLGAVTCTEHVFLLTFLFDASWETRVFPPQIGDVLWLVIVAVFVQHKLRSEMWVLLIHKLVGFVVLKQQKNFDGFLCPD